MAVTLSLLYGLGNDTTAHNYSPDVVLFGDMSSWLANIRSIVYYHRRRRASSSPGCRCRRCRCGVNQIQQFYYKKIHTVAGSMLVNR